MDLTAVTAILVPILGVLTVVQGYLSRQQRATRAENRKLRRLVIDGDDWMFRAQRAAARDLPIPPIPKSWEALHDADDQNGTPAAAAPDPEPTGGGSRHALRE